MNGPSKMFPFPPLLLLPDSLSYYEKFQFLTYLYLMVYAML